jgi:hypothetical protein
VGVTDAQIAAATEVVGELKRHHVDRLPPTEDSRSTDYPR